MHSLKYVDYYVRREFPKEYIPTVFDNFEAETTFKDEQLKYSFWDTAGQSGYARIRTLSYPNTDLFILAFSVVEHRSYKSVKERWYEEVKRHCPETKLLLVGTKTDLREVYQNFATFDYLCL